jgi:hypothetical protein
LTARRADPLIAVGAGRLSTMTFRRILVAPIALVCVLSACSEVQHSIVTTTTPPSTSTTTTVAATTSTSSTTTSTTSTTTSTSTTTTVPAVKGLTLSHSGIGDASFGADADGVVTYVNSVLGQPTSDSGWVDPTSTGKTCSGTEVRFVVWRDLSLYFTDQSSYVKGLRHFASYTYGPAFGATIDPNGLVTDNGVGVGSTVAALKKAYPGVAIAGSNPTTPTARFSIQVGLVGTLSGTHPTDLITSFVGGQACSG